MYENRKDNRLLIQVISMLLSFIISYSLLSYNKGFIKEIILSILLCLLFILLFKICILTYFNITNLNGKYCNKFELDLKLYRKYKYNKSNKFSIIILYFSTPIILAFIYIVQAFIIYKLLLK